MMEFFWVLLATVLSSAWIAVVANTSFAKPPWDSVNLTGDAALNSAFIDITSSRRDKKLNSTGRAYYANPIRFRDPVDQSKLASFSTWFTFEITSEDNCSGDGLAFIISPNNEPPPPGSIGGFLGLVNETTAGNSSNHLFAVEFDTFVNQLLDNGIKSRHVGIDINNASSLYYAPVSSLHGRFQAWIDYNGETANLQVRVEDANDTVVANLSKPVNLSDIFQEHMYVGFSGATGACFEIHRVLEWNLTTSGLSELQAPPPPCSGFGCKRTAIFASLLISLVALFGALALGYWCFKRRGRYGPHSQEGLVRFSYNELRDATGGFSQGRLLGKGGFGKVYKGTFRNFTVAVKVLEDTSMEMEHQFLAELSVLSDFSHPNLVKLRGWCQGRGKLMLVYDYMPNGSLDAHLFSIEKPLDLNQRLKIIKDVADGLHFLHQGREEEKIIHRDIKTGNVLLDADFNARLGDFGLARLFQQEGGLQSVTKVGTFGYIAPELAYAGKATDKSDVYSFGILTLEMFTARRSLSSKDECTTLLEWVWQMHEKGCLDEVVDVKLREDKEYSWEKVSGILHMAMWCCYIDSNSRPSMKECCGMLRGDTSVPLPPACRPPNIPAQWSSAVSLTSTSSSTEPNIPAQWSSTVSLTSRSSSSSREPFRNTSSFSNGSHG